MIYHAVGENILVEEIVNEEEQIISSKEEYIIRGKILSIGSNYYHQLTATQASSGKTPELKTNDTIWFNKREATQMPFNEKLYVVEQSDILISQDE